MMAPSGDQAGSPRLVGGTRAPVTAGSDGSLPSSWLGEAKCQRTGGVHLLAEEGSVENSLSHSRPNVGRNISLGVGGSVEVAWHSESQIAKWS